MSGGSFDYLCYAEPAQLFTKREDIEKMVEALTAAGYLDAAKETESLRLILNQFEVLTQARLDRLSPVWKAMEWKYSGDWTKDQLDETIAEYRKATGQ